MPTGAAAAITTRVGSVAPFSAGDVAAIGLALGLGLLIGVQRGWAARKSTPGSRFAGVRTFALIGLAGGFAGVLRPGDPLVSAIVLVAGAALVLLGYWRESNSPTSVSGTAGFVALLTLTCGYLAGNGQPVVAVVAAGLMVAVLALRSQLHGWISGLTEREVIAISRFGLICLVVLPLLPDVPFGPYGAWRARQLWLVVVMVSGFSFAGYLAARHFGATRGVLATAVAGSIVSSTAVTASLAGKLRAGEGSAVLQNTGIVLASGVMFLRVLALTAVLAPLALPTFAIAAVPGLLVSLAASAWMLRGSPEWQAVEPAPIVLRNPFDLAPALLLAALVMALTLVARWVLDRFGHEGLATVLAITGVIDVDSAIITLGNLPPAAIDAKIAGLVLVPPVVLNSLLKAALALSIPGSRKGLPAALALIASAIATLVAAAAMALV